MREDPIDSLQQQVRTFRCESWEVRVFFWGDGVPPYASDLDWAPPWSLSVSSSVLFLLILLLEVLCWLLSLLSGRLTFPVSVGGSEGGEEPAEDLEEEDEEEEDGGRDGETPRGAPVEFTCVGGDTTPPRRKRGPPGIPPRTCAPVVAGSLWRLPASQRQVAPGRGNSRRRYMAASLAPACCEISNLVYHALWSVGAPLHGDLGSGMAGGYLTELELQETPCLRPSCPHKDVGRPPGPRDSGKDH